MHSFIDRLGLQLDGRTETKPPLNPLTSKLEGLNPLSSSNKRPTDKEEMNLNPLHSLIVINWTLFSMFVLTGIWIDRDNVRRRLDKKEVK